MGFLPVNASFEELVADCFVAFRGSGVMLSPLDAALVSTWAERNVPFEIVARGIRKAAERAVWDAKPGEPALRSLRSCKKDVEAEIKKFVRLSAGRTSEEAEPFVAHEPGATLEGCDTAAPAKKYAAALRKIGRTHAALSNVCSRLAEEALSENAPDPHVREQRISAQLLRALPFPERLKLLREANALAEGQIILSASARKLSRRFHRGAVLRRALDLPAFW